MQIQKASQILKIISSRNLWVILEGEVQKSNFLQAQSLTIIPRTNAEFNSVMERLTSWL